MIEGLRRKSFMQLIWSLSLAVNMALGVCTHLYSFTHNTCMFWQCCLYFPAVLWAVKCKKLKFRSVGVIFFPPLHAHAGTIKCTEVNGKLIFRFITRHEWTFMGCWTLTYVYKHLTCFWVFSHTQHLYWLSGSTDTQRATDTSVDGAETRSSGAHPSPCGRRLELCGVFSDAGPVPAKVVHPTLLRRKYMISDGCIKLWRKAERRETADTKCF